MNKLDRFVKQLLNEEKALNKNVVELGDYGGESEDPYFKLCFGKIRLDDIFDDFFCGIAEDIFIPIADST